MKKEDKIHEALNALMESQRPLFMKFFGLKLSAANTKRLVPHSKALTKAFEDMENELLAMLHEVKAAKGGE